MAFMIETEGLSKRFTVSGTRQIVEAVRGVDLQVASGEIFGFLGPNGAGKTTTQRMLTTLLRPDAGRAMVAGYNLLRSATQVRKHIGAISQAGGADAAATGRENLTLQARLYDLTSRKAKDRVNALVVALDLHECIDRMVSTYSGGQRRRLDLAMGLVHQPVLIFMDEPSTGLDPQARVRFWEEIRKLQSLGTTVFLTTHYMDEADQLCDRLAIIDGGVIVASGTPTQLKKQIVGDVITLSLTQHEESQISAKELLQQQPFTREIHADKENLQVYVENGEGNLANVIRVLTDANLDVRTVALTRPSLEDVFLRQTGHSLREQNSI